MNNVIFAKLIALLNLGREVEVIQQAFELGGNPVSSSKIRAWRIIDSTKIHYRPMPDEALIAFIDGLQTLSKYKLIMLKSLDDLS